MKEEERQAVRLDTLLPGETFRVAAGMLAPGGSSDAGILRVAHRRKYQGKVETTDGRTLTGGLSVHPTGRKARG